MNFLCKLLGHKYRGVLHVYGSPECMEFENKNYVEVTITYNEEIKIECIRCGEEK